MDALINIIDKYPLDIENFDEITPMVSIKKFDEIKPDIIISESYQK